MTHISISPGQKGYNNTLMWHDKSKLNNTFDILNMLTMLIYGSASVSHKIKLIQVKPHQK